MKLRSLVFASAIALSQVISLAQAEAKPVAASYASVPNKYVEFDGVRYAYRVIGSENGKLPLVLFQHFTGTMDDWDSALIEELAASRQVIVFDNAGLGASGGTTPDSIEGMTKVAEGFIDALHLKKVDILGYSIGGFVAQDLLAERPDLVRKAIIVGTGPRGGEGIKNLQQVMADSLAKSKATGENQKVALFFTDSEASQAEAAGFLKRIDNHAVDAEKPASGDSIGAQAKALIVWGSMPDNFADLAKIKQPVLVVNGSSDPMIPPANSFSLYQHIPNAQLILYPDSSHGSLFQYHKLFVSEANTFLDGDK